MTRFMPEKSARHLRALVSAPALADRQHVLVEAVDPAEAAQAPPRAEAVTGRLEAALFSVLEAAPADEVGDPREYRRALEILLNRTRRTIDKLDEAPGSRLTVDDARTLEAVIRADGTRPSLPVHDARVDPHHPLAGDWSATLASTQDALAPSIRAIGRVEPEKPTARDYFGTAWIVDSAAGLALTNLHVVEVMRKRLPHLVQPSDSGFTVRGGVFVDFAVESGRADKNRFRVVEAITPTTVDGPGFTRLDAAVLRLEPTAESDPALPPAIPVTADPAGPAGNLASYCVVGFPGPPQFIGGIHEGIDWTWVNTTLFGNRYGIKRLAPGTTHRPLGTVDGDEQQWVFGHDLTTLGGNSGSPILNWLDDSRRAFGLHFAGRSLDSNYAHAIGACADQLRTMGVPVDDPHHHRP